MEKGENVLAQSLWGRFFQRMITLAVYILFRPKVIWEDKALKKQLKGMPAIFVANHTHHFDGAFMGAVLDRYRPYVLVSRSWYDKKKIGTMLKWCRCLPIDLGAEDAGWYLAAEKYLHSKGSMIIFPEGGIARGGRIDTFKPGAALLSATSDVPVIPAAIYGGYDMVFGKRQRILIGRPIESKCPEDMRHSKYARLLAGSCEQEVKRLYGVLEAQHGRLPVYEESYIQQ
ncbi:MAG: lysophospholipid acyltransferase family protein [Oscillospiraceae bacterium]